MSMLSDDDLSLRDLSDDELVRAWDLWFDLAQVTNDSDPAYAHGVFAGVEEQSCDLSPEGTGVPVASIADVSVESDPRGVGVSTAVGTSPRTKGPVLATSKGKPHGK